MGMNHLIVVVGAGPAGLAVANVMSKQGHEVVVLNRDIKFGGLAEYGIFPNKHKLRGGLRKGYWEILTRPNVRYFGNVMVGNGYHLTVSELRALGPSAVVFSTGAQGTKTIGVEGDTAQGVYHAKDCVYHYNLLPECSTRMYFHFLSSPKRVLTNDQNQVIGLEAEDTKLELRGADPAAVGLKTCYTIPCDSVVFAVGDRVDEAVGLPYKNGVFVTNPNRTQNDPDDSLFQAYDETTGAVIPEVFLCGWARSEEHTSELQSQSNLVCRLLLEKKKIISIH